MPCPDQLDPGFGIGPPHRNAICFAKSYFGIGPDGLGIYRTGTGFLIDNGNVRRHVLTAAHNVFHHDVRREAVWISLWFGRNGPHLQRVTQHGGRFRKHLKMPTSHPATAITLS